VGPTTAELEIKRALNPKIVRFIGAGAFLFLTFHFLLIILPAPGYASGFVVSALGLLRIISCLWWFRKLASSPARFRWLFYGAGAVLGNTSIQIYAWRSLLSSSHNYLSGPASLFTSLACIPILVSITLNFNKRAPQAVRVVDTVLCFTLGYLFLVQVFFSPVAPGGTETASILSVNRLIDFEDIFLLVCAALKFLVSDTVEDRHFLYIYFVYMGISTPLMAVRNRWAARYPVDIWDLAIDIPPLAFLILAFSPLPAWVRHLKPSPRIARLAHRSCPIFISLALILLGLAVSRPHFYLGSTGIVLAIVGYGLRNAIIHAKLLETEDSLLIAKRELEVQATRDGLTGIPNRRSFDETLRREWRSADRKGGTMAILMIDIDLFKLLNDEYGHQVGDTCLIVVAKAIQNMLPRAGDFVGRYGGEEFAVVLPGTSFDGAVAVAERLRSGIVQLAIANPKSQHERVTVSIGVAVGNAASVADLGLFLRTADEALYRAKGAGRNRVEAVDLTTS